MAKGAKKKARPKPSPSGWQGFHFGPISKETSKLWAKDMARTFRRYKKAVYSKGDLILILKSAPKGPEDKEED